jgi:2-polyprenyl-3-methyl-5-hydroxy-6-metoxy-1,4-benzoquinol methylase
MCAWVTEIETRERFRFGRNWQKFLDNLDDFRIAASEKALCDMLDVKNLKGMTFIDAGSGSGLSSLAAMRLSATRVFSFDFDSQSVACTRELRQRYFPNAANWVVEEGSILDLDYLKELGTFDVVYSWGVLHHTGDMWSALDNISTLAANGSKLFIAIYNDEGMVSQVWKWVKKSYNRGIVARSVISTIYFTWLLSRGVIIDVIGRRTNPLTRYEQHRNLRGMSFTRDVVDWLGGYPYEVATPKDIFDLFTRKGFSLNKMKTLRRGHGNNEFVFTRCVE